MNLNSFQWRSLKTRVTLLTLSIFLISIWSLAFYASRLLREDMQKLLGEQQFGTASVIAQEINDGLADRMQALETIAAEVTPDIVSHPAALQTLLEQRPLLLLLFNGGIFATGPDGTAIADVPRSAGRIGVNYIDRDSVALPLRDGKPMIGRPAMGKKLGAPIFSITVPFRDAQGKALGVLVATINLGKPNFLDKATQGSYGRTGGYLLIAPQHKLFVSATDKSRIMQPVPAPGINAMHDRYMQGYQGFGIALSSRGVEELTAAKGIPAAGWFVVASLPTTEAFAPINAMQRRMLMITIFLTLLIGAITWWTTSWLLRRQLSPMLATTRALALLSDSNQPAQALPVARQDEIGELIVGFNRLLENTAQRETLLKQILDTSSVAIFLVDMTGRITQANQRMAEMFDCSIGALIGSEYVTLVHPAEREVGRQKMQALLASSIPGVDLDRLYWRPDHTEFWGHLSGKRFMDANGREQGLVGVIADITTRKQAQEALRASYEALTSVLETTLDGVWQVDAQGHLIDVNPAYCQRSGYTRQELLTMQISQLEALEAPTQIAARIAQLMDTGRIQFETKHRCRDGSLWQVEVSATYRNVDGGRIVSFLRDITERRKSEQFEQFRNQVLELLASDEPLPGILDALVRGVEQVNPALRCAILLPGGTGPQGASWSRTIESSTGQVLGTICGAQTEAHPPTPSDFAIIEQSARLASIAIERSAALNKIRTSEAHYRLLTEGVSDVVWRQDRDNRFTYISPADEALRGYRSDEVVGQHVFEMMTEEGINAVKQAMQRRQSAEQLDTRSDQLTIVAQLHCKDGSSKWVEILSTAERDAQGAIIGFHGVSRNITERREAEEKLHLAASVFTHAREGIMITEADGTIIDVNDAFTVITGYSRDDALGRNPHMMSSGRHDQEYFAAMWRGLIEQGHWYGEIWNRRKSGEFYAQMQTISAVRDPQGCTQQYVSLFSDITAIKDHESELEHIAHFDPLTNLPNRVLLADRLQLAMAQTQRRGQQLAVAYLDLDGFKAINDRHGHEAGDQLLVALAARMKQALREGDTLARIGGDEFVAVLGDLADVAASVPMLTRLLTAAAQPVVLGQLELQVSASLGVTFYPQSDDMDADQLLRQADQAMYQAKLAGKNRYHVFDAAQDSSLRGHHESLEHIRRALNEREFVLHFQPKVNMRTGTVIGAEALIRWQHPQRGLLAPAAFLPSVEDHPLAVEIGEWVIDTALTQVSAWRAAGLDIPVSVNIGARQLQQADFVGRLRTLLAAHPQLDPSYLELEILETSALEDVAQVSQLIEACAQIGVTFALDDFGTGYSSLTYLKRLRVTLLKIDQSFVRDMLEDPDDLAILEGIIGLASAFRREVIAEGVETVAHGAMLLQLGCELAQGYGIARPMPGSELPPWSVSWQPDPTWLELLPV